MGEQQTRAFLKELAHEECAQSVSNIGERDTMYVLTKLGIGVAQHSHSKETGTMNDWSDSFFA